MGHQRHGTLVLYDIMNVYTFTVGNGGDGGNGGGKGFIARGHVF